MIQIRWARATCVPLITKAMAIAAVLLPPPSVAVAQGSTGGGPAVSTRKLTGAEIRAMISGNTVTGRHDNGNPFSEWHAPDGRVFGHNNREPVDRGCWDIRGDSVCYYYSGGSIQGLFCWEFEPAGTGFRMTQVEPRGWAIGVMQPGNPHGHDDNGKPWTCEPLSSELRGRALAGLRRMPPAYSSTTDLKPAAE